MSVPVIAILTIAGALACWYFMKAVVFLDNVRHYGGNGNNILNYGAKIRVRRNAGSTMLFHSEWPFAVIKVGSDEEPLEAESHSYEDRRDRYVLQFEPSVGRYRLDSRRRKNEIRMVIEGESHDITVAELFTGRLYHIRWFWARWLGASVAFTCVVAMVVGFIHMW
jgi:hypothetical protein